MSRTILVADDDQDIIDLVEFNLSREGFSVLAADNGWKALETAKKETARCRGPGLDDAGSGRAGGMPPSEAGS